MTRSEILPWLVELARTDVKALASGPPGDIPNLIFRLRTWLDLEPDEPLNLEVQKLDQNVRAIDALIRSIAELLAAVADREKFEARYHGGGVILDCSKLGTEGGRALSYRDAKLRDAAVRVALDDIYEDVGRALRIRRCRDPQCRKIFFASRLDQTYCNNTCANRTASRRYRKRHGAKRAEQAHDRYVSDVRKKQPGAQVARVPRKYLKTT